MTAFRTRYGLYEWLVTPFGLANAPSTFQKYINWALREYLDEFCSAYLDDVLIYTDGDLEQHRDHIRKVLEKLQKAGLYLDIKKCEFEVKETKYLGFIVQAGQGVKMDPEKVKAIQEWEPPTTVKGVRGFLGFANFYRRFIKNFSGIVRPMIDLTKKGTAFQWTQACQESFDTLKKMFTAGPILATFDPDRTTVVETDSSGYNVGGVLSQYDNEGVLRPCAYFSKRNSPAECNYEIYDKELLAVIRCLEAWDAELRSIPEFQVITDHKNLEYFFSPRKLTERHLRWSLFLSRFNFKFVYRKGTDNSRADALSRREQDTPSDNDDRITNRVVQLFSEKDRPVKISPAVIGTAPSHEEEQDQWNEAKDQDPQYQEIAACLQEGKRKLPVHIQIKISLAECQLDQQGFVQFRGRRWAPNFEPLRTRLIQQAHNPPVFGHPGKEQTYQLVSREYFWPNMSKDIRRFVRNCDVCGRSKAWRDQRQGLLKPLPVPDRPWQELSMDFITDLPESDGKTTILVVTDRLTREVVFEGMAETSSEQVAWALVRRVISKHGFPRSIISDRGPQFISLIWSRICALVGIQKRLSTAYHPQTDGATERMNSTVEAYLRAYTCYDQHDWNQLLPLAEFALNTRTSTTTGTSPFFLSHGFHPTPFAPTEDLDSLADEPAKSPIQKGEAIVRKLTEALSWAQASAAYAQQEAERQANKQRSPAPTYKKDDKVWLSLRNITTDRPNKKLDWKNAKYTVLEVIGTHAVRLNTPPGIHPVFHVDLLRPAATDPFPSQQSDDPQPPAI